MFNPSVSKNSPLSKLLKIYGPEEVVFQQGKPGENMFIIIEGYIRLFFVAEDKKRHLIGVASPGEVLGEKAILKEKKNYIRNFSAYTATPVTLLEVTPATLDMVLNSWPDFYTRVLRLVEERLSKANELVALLQNPSPADRICSYILYFQKHLCAKLPKGMYATISLEEIVTAANVDRMLAEDTVDDLMEKKIISTVANGYILTNEKELIQNLPALRERLSA